MYKTIYVPWITQSTRMRALIWRWPWEKHLLLRSWEPCLCPKMHDYRFKQMEFTLPEEYLDEQELERQRKIHDSLIYGVAAHLRFVSTSWSAAVKVACPLSAKCSMAGISR